MNVADQLPLGTPIPLSQHAVSVSMPTMKDVIGYEEKRPDTMAKLATGYPRFMPHPYLMRIAHHWQRLFGLDPSPIWLTSSEGMARRLQERLAGIETKLIKHRGISGLRLPPDTQIDKQAKLFLQHIGGLLGSREAEDYLLKEGLIDASQAEESFAGDGTALVRQVLSPLIGGGSDGIILANTGMNAVYAAFQGVNAVQRPKGRHSWIALGWLYVDTMRILEKLSPPEGRNEILLDVFDLDRLERILEERGNEIAGILTEAPTNPLIQTADLHRISELATTYGVYFVVDPTVNSPANVDVTKVSHIVVNSLTKYAASEGDVIMGAVAVGERCPDRAAILETVRAEAEAPYKRDVHRLAAQIEQYPEVMAAINRNTIEVVGFLSKHRRVKKVHWALEERSAASYRRLARAEDAVGGLLAFELDGSLEELHDRCALAKGPSFGIRRTLLCPFIYLAHYDLVTDPAGRALLSKAGISSELLRLSIGTEPAESVIGALREALG